jgi:hypothetical protein
MKIAYRKQRFKNDSKYIIKHSDSILSEYQQQGYTLTLRQLYYKFIARDLFPENRRYSWTGSKWIKDKNGTKNAQPNYKWLGNVINNARLAGLIDWAHMEDRTRNLKRISTWPNPAAIIDSALQSYTINKWENMSYYIEVWVEKDALIQIVSQSSFYYQVPCFSCRGYVSQSEMHNSAASRFIFNQNEGKKNILLHLGDHDPSGIDMTRDIKDRLKMFGVKIKVKRIALNMNQIRKYDPPPSPAKITDSRYEKYLSEFGNDSWELDALEPSVIDKLIKNNIKKYIDPNIWEIAALKEKKDKKIIENIILDLE